MNTIFKELFLVAMLIISISVILCAIKDILNIFKMHKNKNTPYYHLTLLKYIIYVEIEILILCTAIISSYFIIKGVGTMELWTDILINIGCSAITSITLSLIIYFKFLKHIPDETKKQIDNLLNERLGYETTNHNAVLHKGDSVQKALSDEHSEIRQNIIYAHKELSSLSGKLDSERELKKLQYEYLNDNNKSIIESVNKISALGETLQKVNYENTELRTENHYIKIKNEQLTQENEDLKKQLEQYQKVNFTQNMKF